SPAMLPSRQGLGLDGDAGGRSVMSSQLREGRVARAGGWLGLLIVVSGAVVLAGWLFDVPALRALGTGEVTMKGNTAIAFVLIGASLWGLHRSEATPAARTLARLAALVAALIGLLSMIEYLAAADLGIDQWLFADPSSVVPGRMAMMTAVNLLLLAAAIWTIDVELSRAIRPSHWLALAVAGNAFLAVLGYLYGVQALYRLVALTAMALHTAVLFLLASAAVVMVRPATRFVRRILRDDAAGLINRRLLPAAVLLPPALAWLALQGQLAGLYSSSYRLALTAGSSVAIFAGLVWWSAATLQRQRGEQRALQQANAWQSGILNSANFSVISTDTSGVIRTINATAAEKLGYRPDELEGKATPELLHDPAEVASHARVLAAELGHPVSADWEAFVAKTRIGHCDENDWTYIRKDGTTFPVRLSVTAMHDDAGRITGFLGVAYDITLQKQAEAKLLQLARSDALTGLANRPHFEEHLAAAIERSKRRGVAMALLFLDIDHFKQVNDTFGHEGGDIVLQEFARRLCRLTRTTDLVARLAGDEFVVVLEGSVDADSVRRIADDVITAMLEPMTIFDTSQVVSASIGVAMLDPATTSGTPLLRRADNALYAAKRGGRGGYHVEG
ncbi:MAG TPA: sensor domain-containing diguanylate cyclase, partial [Luteimonas sp.]|nr:sensor domain-containing diguanylate cyclase [Luteimonas sp.]